MRNRKEEIKGEREREGPFWCWEKDMIWRSLEGKASSWEGLGGGGRPL